MVEYLRKKTRLYPEYIGEEAVNIVKRKSKK
jgi:hypothetical protein